MSLNERSRGYKVDHRLNTVEDGLKRVHAELYELREEFAEVKKQNTENHNNTIDLLNNTKRVFVGGVVVISLIQIIGACVISPMVDGYVDRDGQVEVR